jgi:prepilin peptidase CpaA
MLSTTAISVVALTIFSGLLVWAAVSDFRRYIIPNQVSLGALALYPVYVLSAPDPINWQWALVMAGIFFAVGFVMYLLRTMGAGDAKLLPVVMLWVGAKDFALFMAVLIAGSLVLAFIIGVRTALAQMRASEREAGGAAVAVSGFSSIARFARLLGELRHVPFLKIQVPYGVAIAAGGVSVAVNAVFTTLR